MTELCKYFPDQRDRVHRALKQIADTEGHEMILVAEEHNAFYKGYRISNGVATREIFMIDDPTYRGSIMIIAPEGMQKTIREKVESADNSS